jgi:hypothetical protein
MPATRAADVLSQRMDSSIAGNVMPAAQDGRIFSIQVLDFVMKSQFCRTLQLTFHYNPVRRFAAGLIAQHGVRRNAG